MAADAAILLRAETVSMAAIRPARLIVRRGPVDGEEGREMEIARVARRQQRRAAPLFEEPPEGVEVDRHPDDAVMDEGRRGLPIHRSQAMLPMIGGEQ